MDISRRRAKLALSLLSGAVLSLAPVPRASGQSTGTIEGTAVDSGGVDDWSTSVSMRGFQVHLDEAQIGTTSLNTTLSF